MAPDELRLECLRIAQAGTNAGSMHADEKSVVRRARAYHDFVAGKTDAEIIGAGPELASKAA
jgi:hypothetical protein